MNEYIRHATLDPDTPLDRACLNMIRVAMVYLKHSRYDEALGMADALERLFQDNAERGSGTERGQLERAVIYFLQSAQTLPVDDHRALFVVLVNYMRRFVPTYVRPKIVVNNEVGALIDLHGVTLRHAPFVLWKSFGRLSDYLGMYTLGARQRSKRRGENGRGLHRKSTSQKDWSQKECSLD